MTIEEVIEALGGRERAAIALGVTGYAIDKWRVNGLPSKHWRSIARETGITLDELAAVPGPNGQAA